MKILKYASALMILAAMLTGCASSKKATNKSRYEYIPEHLTAFQPFTYIDYIESGNMGYYSDSLTAIANEVNMEIFSKRLPGIYIDSIIPLFQEEFDALEKPVLEVCNSERTTQMIQVPKPILEFMESMELDEAAFIVESGFDRSRKNYVLKMVGSIGLAVATTLLTAGTATMYTTPAMSNDTYTIFIVDRIHRVVKYRKTVSRESNPIDYNASAKILTNLFK